MCLKKMKQHKNAVINDKERKKKKTWPHARIPCYTSIHYNYYYHFESTSSS